MARYRGTVSGMRGEASRLGGGSGQHRGIMTRADGWRVGVRVYGGPVAGEEGARGQDVFSVRGTGGSGYGTGAGTLAVVREGGVELYVPEGVAVVVYGRAGEVLAQYGPDGDTAQGGEVGGWRVEVLAEVGRAAEGVRTLGYHVYCWDTLVDWGGGYSTEAEARAAGQAAAAERQAEYWQGRAEAEERQQALAAGHVESVAERGDL